MGATYVVSTDFVARDLYTQRLRGMEGATRHFASSAKRDIRSVGDVFRGSFLGTAGANLMASGISRITTAMGNSVTNYVKFDAALGKAALRFPEGAQRGSKAFAALEKGARDLGRTGEATSEQAAQGYQVLAAAGFDVQQSVGALNPILHLSEATNTDFAIAANVAAKSLKAFKLDTDQMTRVSDVYAATNAKTGATVEDLYSAVESGGNAFATSGQSLETYLAIVGNLSTRGIPATRSAMALSQAMLRLSGGSKPASKELKKIGIATTEIGKDGKQHVRGFVDIIGDLNKKLEGKGLTQKQGIIAQIFGAKAMKNLMPLFDGGTDAIKKLQAELENATGTAAKMDEELDKGIGDQIERIKGALSERGLDIVGGIFGGGSNIDGIIASINKFDVSGIVSGVKALGSVLGFMAEHAEGVMRVAEALLIIKGALMLSSGIKTGAGMAGALGGVSSMGPSLAMTAAGMGGGIGGGFGGMTPQRNIQMARGDASAAGWKNPLGGRMIVSPGQGGFEMKPPPPEKMRMSGAQFANNAVSVLAAAGIGYTIGSTISGMIEDAGREVEKKLNRFSQRGIGGEISSLDMSTPEGRAKAERIESQLIKEMKSTIEKSKRGFNPLSLDSWKEAAGYVGAGTTKSEVVGEETKAISSLWAMLLEKQQEVKVEIELTGDAADKAKVGPVKTKNGKGGPSAPSVNRSKTGSQR
jgi:TP901 family phage tail tape measure protein